MTVQKNQRMNGNDTEVLIVGAGPTGLVMAHQLVRHGISFRMIDKHASVLELTKAAALHARTLEIFDDLGIVNRIMDEGQRVDHLFLRTKHRDRIHIDFSDLEDTRFPHMVDIPQNRTENILIESLYDLGVNIEREVELTDLQQYPEGIEITLRHKNGMEESCRAGWLVACDGAKSKVRDLLGLEFRGEPYADDWVLCDATIEWPLPRNEMTFSSSEEGIFGVFPLPGEKRYRIAYTQNVDEHGNPVEPTIEDAQHSMVNRTGIEGEILYTDNFSVFNLAHRQAKHYRQGRAFLVGDAAHIHTPFGGQGMNLGIADAYNIGWKLAYVLKGYAPENLLDSYEAERHPIGRNVVRTTHIGAYAMLMREGGKTYLRDSLMTVFNTSATFRLGMIHRLSQLAHHYRGTQLVSGKAGSLTAGDRVPNQLFFDGRSNSYLRLFDLLDHTKFSLFLVDGGNKGSLVNHSWREIVKHIREHYPDLIKPHLITTQYSELKDVPEGTKVWLDRAMDLTHYHQPGTLTAYLVRPDGHLAYVHSPVQLEHLTSFLHHTPYFQPKAHAKRPKDIEIGTYRTEGDRLSEKPEVVPIITPAVNCYMIRGEEGSVLVDTGFPGKTDVLLKKLKRKGVNPKEISLILLTHGHPDHAGNAAELRQCLGVPVAIHRLEAEWMRTGKTVIPSPVRPFGHVIKALSKPEIPSFEPDLQIEEGTSLNKYGVKGRVLHTPGHSPGSISLLLDSGDALVGDLMAGGLMFKDRPDYMFLLEDVSLTRNSIKKLLTYKPSRLFFGHGQPASGESAQRCFVFRR
ncbi:FAD-dependent monooxygenase [Melghirimyces algeriensis]|uniref:2-polyprenyl-6-methoxyphenol hydroxylase n=1 Tax=Melghirimyces algeriensis TaxID=910412 RepID=A0A521CCH3_9BACL|nr:FAD-dependent monooxygenase [Melghirimyces algeriensis]SMO57126.1 2-polyprenyl-6-methoxyphenol hydroxylase [Melghirimyces algeriensis]